MASHAQLAWLMSEYDPSRAPRGQTPLRRRRRRSGGAFLAATVAALALAAGGAATAQAAPLKLADAREAAVAAVAPSPVDGARCFYHPGSRRYRARAFCIVNHPPVEGGVCRTFLAVRRREGSVVARVFGRADCTPSLLQDIEP